MRGSLRSPWQLEGNHTSCCNSRNTLRCPLPCELRPDSPSVTPEHSRARPHNSNGDLTSLRQHERLPEFPVVPGEESQASRHNSKTPRRFPCQREMRPFSPTAANFPSHHKRRPVSPIESQVEPHGFCCKEKGHQVPPQLQISPDSPGPAPVEHRGSPHNMMGGLTPMLILLRKPKFPA